MHLQEKTIDFQTDFFEKKIKLTNLYHLQV